MIINSGAGAGGSSITTRTVTLDEVYFSNYIYDYTTYGYRTFCDSDKSYYYKTFYFPGKVIKVLSYKYMFKTTAGGTFTAEQTFTGNWFISGNTATPELQCTNKYYYRPTELIAVVEDSVIGGTTTTITITTSEWTNARGDINKMLAGNNIVSCSLTTDVIPYVGSMIFSGSLFSTTGSNYYPPHDLNFTVKQGNSLYQGITHRLSGIYQYYSSLNALDFYTGFDPNVIVMAKNGTPSSAVTVGQGLVAGLWVRPGLYNTSPSLPNGVVEFYNSLIYNNYNAGDLFYPISVTYYPNTGMVRMMDGSTYPTTFSDGTYAIISMK